MRDMNCRVCSNETNPFLAIPTDELDEPFLDDVLRKDLPELRLSRCARCGCLWATDVRQHEQVVMAAYERLSALYFDSEAVTSRFQEFYKWLERSLEKNDSGNSILDVGCGDGNFLSTLSDSWSKRGLEPSKAGTELARRKHLQVDVGSLDSCACPYEVDLISALDVIEHVVDPHKFIESIKRHLKPNGMILLVTGDAESHPARIAGCQWSYLRWCGHISVFSAAGLRMLLKSHGFEILDWERCEHPSSAGFTAWWRVHLLEPARRMLGRAKSWYPFWRDHQMVIARLNGRM
ncbi:MAG TPA: class I SAM-dependent methyltransferase [Pyrinomonadaceae bacterium]|nr:class I SAM-dependent methyltransferase [Pyrinomonadaceae bacterium]